MKSHLYFHWYYHHLKKAIYFNLGLGVFIWLFLSLTMPFGIYNNNLSHPLLLLLILFPVGMLWPLISIAVDYIIFLLPKINPKDNFRLDFLILLVKVAFWVNTFYILRQYLCNWKCMSWYEYGEQWFAGYLMFFLVYFPFTFYARSKYFSNMIGKSKSSETDHHISLKGEGKESLEIDPDQIVYIQSDNNYVQIVTNSEKGKSILLRAKLKSIEAQLLAYNQFVKVHRSYLINLKYFAKTGVKNTIMLDSSYHQYEIPVSRKHQEKVVSLLS